MIAQKSTDICPSALALVKGSVKGLYAQIKAQLNHENINNANLHISGPLPSYVFCYIVIGRLDFFVIKRYFR